MNVKADEFAKTVQGMLSEYGDECIAAVKGTVQEVADDARKELRSSGIGSFHDRTGKYRKSWAVNFEDRRVKFTAHVYARSPHYRLTHLLEYGHALRRGGRLIGSVKAYPHIGEVNDWAQDRAVRKLREKLGKV